MRDVFFGETGPVAIPKATAATASARETDAAKPRGSRKSRDSQGTKTPPAGSPASLSPASESPASGSPASVSPASLSPASGSPASGSPTSTRADRKAAKAHAVATHHRVTVTRVDEATLVVRLDQAILGYIHRAGTVYVALRGATLGLAVEVGQSVSRARAFTLLHSDWRVQTASA
jgi:hypothetical protein